MSRSPLASRVVFMGSPEPAARLLQALLDDHIPVVGVFTQPDRPAGRRRQLVSTPVAHVARSRSIPCHTPHRLRDPEVLHTLQTLAPTLIVVAIYGLIVPQRVLDLAPCWNIHYALLPHHRGASPIQHALLAGDTHTGITLMQMDAGLDTGPVIAQTRRAITEGDTTPTLCHALTQDGIGLLRSVLHQALPPSPVAQPDRQVSWAPKLRKSDGRIDWTQSAAQLVRQGRALQPWPGVYFHLPGRPDEPVHIIECTAVASHPTATPGTVLEVTPRGMVVQTGSGALCITRLHLPGRTPQPVAALLQGRHPFQAGLCLTA